jgi:hypothetical protein
MGFRGAGDRQSHAGIAKALYYADTVYQWALIDTSELSKASLKPVSAEQLLLPLIRSIREEDVEIIEVAASSDSSLRVMLKIRFSNEKSLPRLKNRAHTRR